MAKKNIVMNTQAKAGEAAKAERMTQAQRDKVNAPQFTQLGKEAREYLRQYDTLCRDIARQAKKAREDAQAAAEDIKAAQDAGKAEQAARMAKAEAKAAEARAEAAKAMTARRNSAARLFFSQMTITASGEPRVTARSAFEAYAGRAARSAVWNECIHTLLAACGLRLTALQAAEIARELDRACGLRVTTGAALCRTEADKGGTTALAAPVAFASFPRLFLAALISIIDNACPDCIGTEYGLALTERRRQARAAKAEQAAKALRAEIERLQREKEAAEARADKAQAKAAKAAEAQAEAEARAQAVQAEREALFAQAAQSGEPLTDIQAAQIEQDAQAAGAQAVRERKARKSRK